MKRFKRLTLMIDGSIIRTIPVALPENGDDCQCPACYGTRWTECYSIVQHGFGFDDCLDIIECDACHNVYHVQYEVVFATE